jgi:hypothetical protein
MVEPFTLELTLDEMTDLKQYCRKNNVTLSIIKFWLKQQLKKALTGKLKISQQNKLPRSSKEFKEIIENSEREDKVLEGYLEQQKTSPSFPE